MATPEKVFDHIDQAISIQALYNVKNYGLYKDDNEKEDVIIEELDEVIDAFNKYKNYLYYYDFKDKNSNFEMKNLLFHLIEECIHVITAINKSKIKE